MKRIMNGTQANFSERNSAEYVQLMRLPPSSAQFLPRVIPSETMPLLGHSTQHRSRSRIVVLAVLALLVAVALVAASNSEEQSTTLLAALKPTQKSAPSIRSEDRFVSAQNAYVKSMNGNGGISVFDPR
jgi:hypothetical protein